MMKSDSRTLYVLLAAFLICGLAAPSDAAPFAEARIYIEYNSTDNDLGFHVFLDAEDWNALRIARPDGQVIAQIAAKGGFETFGLTELFFEGAEPTLDDVPLADLLAFFPEGPYTFVGTTVSGARLMSKSALSHAVPAGPVVWADVAGDSVTIHWLPVTGPAPILPDETVTIVGYQVIAGSFQVTLPASSTSVELPKEYVRSLAKGAHEYEVLAIEASRNQTITSSTFSTN